MVYTASVVGQSTRTQMNLLHIAGQPDFSLPDVSGTRKSCRFDERLSAEGCVSKYMTCQGVYGKDLEMIDI